MDKTDEALAAAKDALKTWVCIHAPDLCKEEHVQAARGKVSEFGTLWYIAQANKLVMDAIEMRAGAK